MKEVKMNEEKSGKQKEHGFQERRQPKEAKTSMNTKTTSRRFRRNENEMKK
jgi:hypothetical protein